MKDESCKTMITVGDFIVNPKVAKDSKALCCL